VTAPPYDVIDGAERAALAAAHPANAVHVDCPVGDLGTGGSGAGTESADPYADAGATFQAWLVAGDLVADPAPSFTLYRMSFADETGRARSTTGVIGALGLEPPGQGDVLPHERTTPKAKSDRLDLLRAARANLSPVWGLSLAEGLSALLEPAGPPLAEWNDPDFVTHAAWRVDDPDAVAAIRAAVASAPVVIADGHHRYQTCLDYQAEVGATVPGADATLCLVVELVESQLTVQPIHRLLTGLPAGFDVLEALAPTFDVIEAGPPPGPEVLERMAADGALLLVLPGGSWLLHPRAEALADVPDLDSSRLDAALEGFPEHGLAYQHGVAQVVDAVESGRADAGFLLRPVTVAQIADVAHARDRMPPKTTFFWPKPRTGVVFRSLA
ncbi:MAG: DUF1015 domain-containing protein, partial [Acidimicrobiia bacterium]|nr:DUF1015 domain-containing protein [Acidimicrobiia bacterium]